MRNLLLWCMLLVGTSALADDFVIEKKAVMFVLDISASMQGANLRGVQGTLAQVVKSMPESTTYGLVSFSGCAPENIRLEVPLAPGNGPQLVSRANALQPNGSTDIFGGLSMAAQEIKRMGSDWCVKVILLSDGEDTCSRGDVKGAVKKIVGDAAGCNSISAISIGVPAWESQVFEDVTKEGKGKHYPVEDNKEAEKKIDEEIRDFIKKGNQGNKPDWQGDYSPPKTDPKNPGDPDKPKDPGSPDKAPDPDEAKNENHKKNKNK